MPSTIVITGASSGIGKALAIHYARQKRNLILTGRNRARLNETADICEKKGANVVSHTIDVTNKAAMQEWLVMQDSQYPIDLVIANAGCSSTQIQMQHQNDHDVEAAMVNIHFQGMLNTIHPILPRMLERKSGQIALMSSMNAFFPLARSAIYGSQKAAVYHYGLSSRARYLQCGVQFNVICPGWVNSALTALNRFPMPWKMSEEKAAAIISRGLGHNKAVIRFPWQLNWVRYLFQCLPLSVQQAIAKKC